MNTTRSYARFQILRLLPNTIKAIKVIQVALLIGAMLSLHLPTLAKPRVGEDVKIGVSLPIPYARAFPLLDGIFQDVSAIQLKQLSLDPNVSNAANLNAVLEQFQFGVQASRISGVQNALAARQAATGSAAAVLQTQLITQQTQLISLELAAQQQVGKAQAALDALPENAAAEDKAALQQSLTLANDNLNSIAAQLGNIKSLLATSAVTPSFSEITPDFSSIQSPPVTLKLPGGDAFTPSFPASKQMDNQVNLLWERLARLVTTLAQSQNPDNIYLVPFHTGITSGQTKVKRELLSTQYTLTCKDGSEQPKVLDLFPRSAAVNIADQKYKDSRTGLSALLSFFSVGVNAAYNREHLRITQALGQSAYITGFGIETSDFGWIFGPTLGEDFVAPGDRLTFALISAPQGCTRAAVKLVQKTWDKIPNANGNSLGATELRSWDVAEPSSSSHPTVKVLSYTPAEFDPQNPKPVATSISLTLSGNVDSEETVSVDGVFLRRARDTFGRATATGGTGGLLETGSIDTNTWIPVSSQQILLNLDASQFTRGFPRILLSSPGSTIDVMNGITCSTEVTVSGRPYECTDGARAYASVLPAPGRPKAVSHHFGIARWLGKTPRTDRLTITVQEPSGATSAASATSDPTLQVITDSQTQPWSSRAKVVAHQGARTYPLECEPLGQRLVCNFSPKLMTREGSENTLIDVFDSDYAGGPIKGAGTLAPCGHERCVEPLVWELHRPVWESQRDAWIFRVSMINVKNGQEVVLGADGAESFQATIQNCTDDEPCTVDIPLPKNDFGLLRNSMLLQVKESPTSSSYVGSRPTEIGNLRAVVLPVLVSISEDQTHFSGQNLIFEKMQVGDGKPIKLTCADALDCFIGKFGPKDDGYLFFVAGSQLLPFMIVTDKGLSVVAPHHPKKPEDKTKAAVSQKSTEQTKTAPPRLYSIK